MPQYIVLTGLGLLGDAGILSADGSSGPSGNNSSVDEVSSISPLTAFNSLKYLCFALL